MSGDSAGEELAPPQRSAADLIERCELFGESAIRLAKAIPRNPISSPLISQFVRSSTSLGANYSEAQNGLTRKEFFHRIGICQKEANETKHWIRMLVAADEDCRPEARRLWKEANELHLIFSSILNRRGDAPK